MNKTNAVGLTLCLLLGACGRTPAEKEARFIQRGKELVQKQDYQRATLEFRNAIQVMPKDAEPVYQLALAYVAVHDYRNAFAFFNKVVDMNPKYDAAQLAIAKFQVGAPDPATLQQAKERVTAVLASRPNDPDALNTLAALDMRLGAKTAAVQDLQTAVNESPKDLDSAFNLSKVELNQHNSDAAESTLKSAVRNSPQSAEARLVLARLYLKTGKKAEAETEVRRAVQLDAKNTEALLLLGAFEIEHGQNSDAERTYQQLAARPGKEWKPVHAAFLLREGKRDQAISELKTLLKEDPGDRNVRSVLVSLYIEAGKPQDAELILNEALKRNPKDLDALLQRSTFLFSTGKWKETESDLRTVLASNPESAQAHYGLARVAGMRGSVLVQRQELGEALRLDPKMLTARVDLSRIIRTKDPQAALSVLNEAPTAQQHDTAYVVEKNWALLALHKDVELRKSLEDNLAGKRAPELLYQDALLKVSQRNYQMARPPLEELLKSEPENISALDLLAKTFSAQGNTPKAIEIVEKQVAQRPKSAYLLSLLGVWQTNAHHVGQARQSFMSAITEDPNYTPARFALADLEMSENDPDSARRTLQEVLSKYPSDASARLRMAFLEDRAGNRMAARDQFRAVVQAEPKNEAALNGLAFVLAEDNPEEALRYAQDAVELAPNDPAAQDTLGWVYYRKNRYSSALTYLKTAVQKQPTAIRCYHLALAYARMGDQELARQNLKTALQLDPKLQMPEPLAQ